MDRCNLLFSATKYLRYMDDTRARAYSARVLASIWRTFSLRDGHRKTTSILANFPRRDCFFFPSPLPSVAHFSLSVSLFTPGQPRPERGDDIGKYYSARHGINIITCDLLPKAVGASFDPRLLAAIHAYIIIHRSGMTIRRGETLCFSRRIFHLASRAARN